MEGRLVTNDFARAYAISTLRAASSRGSIFNYACESLFLFFFFCLPRVDYPRFTRRSIVSRYVIPRFYTYSRTTRSRGYAEEIHGISNNWDLYRTLSSPMIAILFDLIDLLYNYNTYFTIQSSTP